MLWPKFPNIHLTIEWYYAEDIQPMKDKMIENGFKSY